MAQLRLPTPSADALLRCLRVTIQKRLEILLELCYCVGVSGKLDKCHQHGIDAIENLVQFRIHRLRPFVNFVILLELRMSCVELAAERRVHAHDRVHDSVDVLEPCPGIVLRNLKTVLGQFNAGCTSALPRTAPPAPLRLALDVRGSTTTDATHPGSRFAQGSELGLCRDSVAASHGLDVLGSIRRVRQACRAGKTSRLTWRSAASKLGCSLAFSKTLSRRRWNLLRCYTPHVNVLWTAL